jgi:hypothetical protein
MPHLHIVPCRTIVSSASRALRRQIAEEPIDLQTATSGLAHEQDTPSVSR